MGTLMASTVVSAIIAIVDLCITVVKKIKKSCCNDNKVKHLRSNHPEAASHIGQDFSNAVIINFPFNEERVNVCLNINAISREENKENRSASDIDMVSPHSWRPKKIVPS